MESLLFYTFSAIIITIITIVAYKHSPTEHQSKVFLFPISILLFQVAIILLSSTGFYVNFDLPPRLVYAGIVPSFIMLFAFSFSKAGKSLLKSIPNHYPILFQSFRIVVELFIYWTFLLGYGPKEATMVGYNYEFYFGIVALIFGVLVWKKRVSKKLILTWNIIGLFLLAFIVGIFFTTGFAWDSFWGRSQPMITNEMLNMPIMSIATLYMPLAVWMHIFSIRQTIRN